MQQLQYKVERILHKITYYNNIVFLMQEYLNQKKREKKRETLIDTDNTSKSQR